jgi:hypothetical protein
MSAKYVVKMWEHELISGQLGGAATVSNVQATAGRTHWPLLALLLLLLIHG